MKKLKEVLSLLALPFCVFITLALFVIICLAMATLSPTLSLLVPTAFKTFFAPIIPTLGIIGIVATAAFVVARLVQLYAIPAYTKLRKSK